MNLAPVNRLLLTTDTLGGVWTFAQELSESLASSGVEVLLACLGGRLSSEQRAAMAGLPNITLVESRYKLEWMHDPWADVAASGDWLLELAERFQPDVVHLNSFGHGALPWQVPTLLTAHSCVLSWWMAVHKEAAPAEWNRYRDFVERSISSADGITAPSKAMLDCLHRCYRAPMKNSRVIRNGRRADRFRRAPKEPFVLAAGRLWDDAKNIAALERISPRLSWPCFVAGEPCHPDGSEARFRGCEMLGKLAPERLFDWYARASVYALPARYEPFGLSALEAALSGCALVLGDIDSLREVWGDAAIFVDPEDDRALELALTSLIEDPRLRAVMSARSVERARSFSAGKMAQDYLEAYRDVIVPRASTDLFREGFACVS
jgi:glycogen(starch) synthase